MNKKFQITLDDIAKKLNVSKVTVSKALRGHPDISYETTQKVKTVAKELGYTPNFMARNLSSKSSHTIGLVVPKIAHYFFGSVIESIYEAALENNYEIILTVSQENAEREENHIRSLLSMRVDGLIISISQQTKKYEIFNTVKNYNMPLVFMDRVVELPGFSSVTVDDQGGSFNAIEYAIKTGYTKIAHFAGFQEINIGKRRYLGFKKAMKKYNIPINPDWVLYGGFGEEDGYKAFKKLYNSNNLPEFIFAVTFPVALGVYSAVYELGLKIPDDIEIMCFGSSDINKFLSPSISCVNQPTEELGRKSVELILENIKNPVDFVPKNIEIPTSLIIRDSAKTSKGILIKK
ncbi:MAG: LacI family DNA-binding transcriptional regulator [Ignavibacteriaceae bacterium]